MSKPMKLRQAWMALLICWFAPVAATADAAGDSALSDKLKLFERYEPHLALPLAERVRTMPDDLLKFLIDFDRSIGIRNTDYRARTLTPGERALFMTYVGLLPEKYRTTFGNKLLAVYFVDNFAGAGLTDWVADNNGVFYYHMILNSDLLTRSLDDWLSWRENSFFAAGSPWSIRVRTGTDYRALLYGLLHEGGHVVDIEYHVTPYVDDLHRKVLKQQSEVSDFTRGVWEGQNKPVAAYDFNNQDRLNVYGIFDRELVPGSEMQTMFLQLRKTPFVSFYGGTSWLEDFADLITYHHIERNMGGAIRVEFYKGEKLVKRISPTKRKLGEERKKLIKDFIDETLE